MRTRGGGTGSAIATGLAFALLGASAAWAAEPVARGSVEPLLQRYCARCHNGTKHEGDVDLAKFDVRPKTLAGRKAWQRLLHQLESAEMPPEEPLPTAAERERLTAWVRQGLEVDWSKVRDPGRVTLPRLTRTEYSNTLRDLLGVDVQPAAEFAPDGEGASGFDNDRDALYLTPALLEKYLAAAERALDAVVALESDPVERRFESEKMFMTETSEKPQDFGDGFVGYVLNRGQMTLYDSVRFPHDGHYEFAIRARSTAGPTGTRLRLDGKPVADFVVLGGEPETITQVRFVAAGSRQMTWNIEPPSASAIAQRRAEIAPDAEKDSRPAPPAPAERRAGSDPEETDGDPDGAQGYRRLPANANDIVGTEARKHAPKTPLPADAPGPIRELAAKVDEAAYSVQRPYEWLRLLGTDGDPKEIARFKGYVADRTRMLDAAKGALAEALGLSREEFDRRYDEANGERTADNKRLLAAVAKIAAASAANVPAPRGKRKQAPPAPAKPVAAKPGSVAIDWIVVRGPVHPEGTAGRGRVFVARPGPQRPKRDAARAILADFLPRAFRRPVEDGEIERHLRLFDRGDERGDPFEASMKLALTSALVSPHFLYRTEFGPVGGEYRLDDHQLASRLSYFLWLSMPDDELFALARARRLHEPEVLTAQVDRMLADPKCRSFATAFTGQWLGIASLGESVLPDKATFPQFTPELAEAMKAEATLAFESLLKDDRSLLELLDSRETWLNEPLAKHYGISGVQGDAMRRVALSDPQRGGLLGMGAVLTATSSPTRTSPVGRGKWILETLLGETIPEPPADAGALASNAGEVRGKTLREELLQHRRNPSCAACHDRIDPVGFGLERFDAVGRLRDKEAGRAIDDRGALPGGVEFRGGAELKRLLLARRKEQFARNVVERTLGFALGRSLQLYDEPTLAKIASAVAADDFRARTLIRQIVLSFPFQYQSDQRRLE